MRNTFQITRQKMITGVILTNNEYNGWGNPAIYFDLRRIIYMVATPKNDLIRNVKPVGQNVKPKDSKLMKESRSKNNLMQNTRGMK